MAVKRGKRAPLRANAWLFGIGVPAVAFFVLFSLMPYGRMVETWPLGIRSDEVMAYQRFFDRRPGQHVDARTLDYRLSEGREGCSGVALIFQAEGYRDSVTALRVGEGYRLRFPAQRPFGKAEELGLVPATLADLPMKYAQLIADSLGSEAASLELVHLLRCEGDAGLFFAQPQRSPRAVDSSGIGIFHFVNGRPVMAGGDTSAGRGILAAVAAGINGLDTAAVAAVAFMAMVEERPSLLEGEGGFSFDRIAGRIAPLYILRGLRPEGDTIVPAPLHAAMVAVAQQSVAPLAAHMCADSTAWDARFRSIDSTWVPALAGNRNLGLVQAEVDRRRERTLQRLSHPDVGMFGPVQGGIAMASAHALDPWLVPFRTEPDTIRFRRGKYSIDHDLVLPAGMALVLEKGTRWNIAPGVRIVVNGSLFIRGTGLNPVFLRPQADGPYATLAVNGSGRTDCRIRGLRMSGGGMAWVDGSEHAGMLSLHGVDLAMTDCAFGEATGPAAVSVRRGTVRIEGCSFAQPRERALELMEAPGNVRDCAFGATP